MRNDAFHSIPKINNGSGITILEWAAVMLKVPESGNEKLDEMIRKAKKDGK